MMGPATDDDLTELLADGAWHAWMVAYGSMGSVMELALHRGDPRDHRGVLCRGVSYYRGLVEGGPYRLRLRIAIHSDWTERCLADVDGKFEVRCHSVEFARLQFLRIGQGGVDRVSALGDLRPLTATAGNLTGFLRERERELMVFGYRIDQGGAMRICVHDGFPPRGRFLVAHGVSYFEGDLGGGPYRLDISEEHAAPGHPTTICDDGGRLIVKCRSVEMGRITPHLA